MVSSSSEQLNLTPSNKVLEIWGSSFKDNKIDSRDGGSMNSNFKISLIPIALSIKTVLDKFCLWISGTVLADISF
ncbi:hypothetical protein WICPIJ_002415 [Wickerhamomyces pijperi]|uniref:Uncharacterized protein n=1 Tax=Wickerhamomyces pijperi TaxID=599730 RepID=A0A9P8TQ75_WICPI|nr:hypothetical protein WICPIJ_002415 [Wickerhamomyces pijperi]